MFHDTVPGNQEWFMKYQIDTCQMFYRLVKAWIIFVSILVYQLENEGLFQIRFTLFIIWKFDDSYGIKLGHLDEKLFLWIGNKKKQTSIYTWIDISFWERACLWHRHMYFLCTKKYAYINAHILLENKSITPWRTMQILNWIQ